MCVWVKQDGHIPPRVKDPDFILGQTYVSSDESSRKCQKAYEAYGDTLEIRNPNKHTRFDKLKLKGCCGVPTLSEGGSHSQILLWQVPIAFFFRLHESSNPRPQGPILKWDPGLGR